MRSRCLMLALVATALVASTVVANPSGPSDESPTGGASSARLSNKLNPAISFNALLCGAWRSRDVNDPSSALLTGPETGLSLEEGEVVFTSVVDPYLKADAIIALEDTGNGYDVDLEEVFVTAMAAPRGLGLRAGKMLLPFGRHNQLHSHLFPFIDPPLVAERIFGDDGLNDVAIEASWLLPVAWFSQLVGVVSDGRNALFDGASPNDLMFMTHFRNLVDLSPSQTLEVGTSALWGRAANHASTAVYGLNATLKYRPTRRSQYHSMEVQGELMRLDRNGPPSADPFDLSDASGGYLHLRWQMQRRWWLQGRYDRMNYDGDQHEDRWSCLVAFVPSEFNTLRFEYTTLAPTRGHRDHQLLAQLGFSIGSHPAHSY